MTKSPINTWHALIDWTKHLCMTELSTRIKQLAIYGIPFWHRSCFWQLIALQAKISTWRCRLPIALGLTVQAWWCFPSIGAWAFLRSNTSFMHIPVFNELLQKAVVQWETLQVFKFMTLLKFWNLKIHSSSQIDQLKKPDDFVFVSNEPKEPT